MSEPTPLTDTEKTLVRVITARRQRGWGGQKTRTFPKDNTLLGYWFDAAHRSGSVYSAFAQFTASEQCEWTLRVLDSLSEERFEMPSLPEFQYDDGWDKAKAAAVSLFETSFEAQRSTAQGEHDADPAGFSNWSSAVVEGGYVSDPWGYNYEALCRWFLNNATKMVVFAVYQTVRAAVENSMADDLGRWAIGDGEDPRKAAAQAYDDARLNLDDYIEGVLKVETTDTIADLLGVG